MSVYAVRRARITHLTHAVSQPAGSTHSRHFPGAYRHRRSDTGAAMTVHQTQVESRPKLNVDTRRARAVYRLPQSPLVPLAHACMDEAAHGCVEWFIYPRQADSDKPNR